MAFRALFKYGVPFSFVYCTIYQQNIWREGDEMLVEEQKKTWRKFFNLIDNGYHTALDKLNLSSQPAEKRQTLVSKLDSLDIKNCYNAKVSNTFIVIDQIVANPKVIACKLYRKVQPYLSQPAIKKEESKTEA